ncbi:hypothetical protein [Calycomorphotria hydatis]|uniref:Uncharacterized protein n=1 Tax=Calycomorphotria hydatis TaxID=2528027 RepID=A0A517T9L5_9PLAN|nr:hypothetical protein [Calycomorphotria hydatis]QDT65061.1 hypothetical protein V22_23070 [Calycomorphotria hydatis]
MNPLTELKELEAPFETGVPLLASVEHVPAALMPKEYQCLLSHNEHMTVAMEAKYATTVDVHVLDDHLEGDIYRRKITLTKHGTDDVVQFGLVKFDFSWVDNTIRDGILSKNIPLGRVLIRNNVLRHVDLGALLRVTAGPGLAEIMKIPVGTETYGRLATIFCDGKPAVDLLEISAPLPTK